MSAASRTPETETRGLWLLRMHYRMRTASFAMVFAASCLHLHGQGYAAWTWAYLASLLLLYPQLLHWMALRTPVPATTALRALLLDSFLLGTFCAVVRFADWLSFSVVLATLINNAANRGMKDSWQTLLALLLGAALGAAVCGFGFAPHTEWPTVLVCILGLTAYVLEVGHIAYLRNAQLRATRAQLRLRERALVDANARLQKSLEENDALRRDLAEQASRDPLTNLYNRRYLAGALPREMQRCERESKPLALVIMDLDHFKHYNDHYGHAAGDACLKAVARAIQASAKRSGDLAARFGGEEFVLLLPDTDASQALAVAEALRQSVAAMALPHAKSPLGRVTLSLGVAVSLPQARLGAEALLHSADTALYAVKKAGRNGSQLAKEPPPPALADNAVLLEVPPAGG